MYIGYKSVDVQGSFVLHVATLQNCLWMLNRKTTFPIDFDNPPKVCCRWSVIVLNGLIWARCYDVFAGRIIAVPGIIFGPCSRGVLTGAKSSPTIIADFQKSNVLSEFILHRVTSTFSFRYQFSISSNAATILAVKRLFGSAIDFRSDLVWSNAIMLCFLLVIWYWSYKCTHLHYSGSVNRVLDSRLVRWQVDKQYFEISG